MQVSCFFIAIAIPVYIFLSIRPYTLLFIGQAMYFPLLRLSTIPNGKITIVENLTKDWSRAECIFEIDQGNDIKQALDVIKSVSEEMQNDGLWHDKISVSLYHQPFH